MKTTTQREYTHENGYSSGRFVISAKTVDKKVTEFHLKTPDVMDTSMMRLLAKDLEKFAENIDSTENPADAERNYSAERSK